MRARIKIRWVNMNKMWRIALWKKVFAEDERKDLMELCKMSNVK